MTVNIMMHYRHAHAGPHTSRDALSLFSGSTDTDSSQFGPKWGHCFTTVGPLGSLGVGVKRGPIHAQLAHGHP